MTIQQTLEQVFKVAFKKQPNLKILRGESHDASFVCDDKDPQRLIGLNVRKQKALTKVVIPKEWEALEYLNLSDNKNLERLEFAGALPNLGYLDLSDNDLKEIMLPDGMSALKDLTISNNKLTAITFQGNLPALRLLDLSSNHLVTLALPQGMESLQYLYLNNNNLTEFKPSRPLVKLDTLALKNNDFQDLPLDFLDAFYNLKTLYLQENPLSNPPKISIDKSSYGNSLGILKEHHIECAKGMEINNECKVLLIGNGSVGKTCFVIRLVENRFVKEWESTHAINLRQYPYKGYLLNLWDFAGQDIYHATHRLFMQRDAIYLVLWDKVTENTPQSSRPEGDKEQFYDNHSLNYWLHYCRMLGKDSPIIVVQTKVGKEGLEIKDCPQIRKDFTKKGHFLKFQHIESGGKDGWKDNDWDDHGYTELLQTIERGIEKTKENKKIATGYYNIRKAIRKLQQVTDETRQKTMSLDDYLILAGDKVDNPMRVLEDWLSKTGVVFYSPNLFGGEIILDQDWAISAVYSLFKPDSYFYQYIQNIKNKGQFQGKDLDRDWHKFSASEQELFISFMLECELCFEITEKENKHDRIALENRTFIAPQFLSVAIPDLVNHIKEEWEEEEIQWHIRYTYPILHYGIIQSFIVRTQTLSSQGYIWRNGIYIKEGKQKAIIEANQGNKTILVQVSKNSKELLDKIRNLLEELQEGGAGMEMVSADGQNFVSMEKLKNWPKENLKIQAEGSGQWVLTDSLKQFLEKDDKTVFVDKEKMAAMQKMDLMIQKIKDYLVKNEFDKAFQQLENLVPEQYETAIINIIGTYNELVQKRRDGVINSEDMNVGRGKIRERVFEILKAIKNSSAFQNEELARLGGHHEHYEIKGMLGHIDGKLDSLGTQVGQMSVDVQAVRDDVKQVLQKLTAQDRLLIEQLELSRLTKVEIAEAFLRIEEKLPPPADMERIIAEIDKMMSSQLSSLPEDLTKTWKELNTKSALEGELKGKFKLKIPIILGILNYEKELSFDLKKMANEIRRKGIIF